MIIPSDSTGSGPVSQPNQSNVGVEPAEVKVLGRVMKSSGNYTQNDITESPFWNQNIASFYDFGDLDEEKSIKEEDLLASLMEDLDMDDI